MAATKIKTNQIELIEILKLRYPVGSKYTNHSVDTNPATLFGFGTWERIAQGRVIVGIDSGDTDFDTAGETGGTKTVTVSTGQLPQHTHTQNSHNHTQDSHLHDYSHNHQVRWKYFVISTGTAWNIGTAAGASGITGYDSDGAYGGGGENVYGTTATNIANTATNQNTGGGGSHNNVMPYQVAVTWKRTA